MHFPSWLRWYKKPSYRDVNEYASAIREGTRDISPTRSSGDVPSRLSLDRILKNETCSPMSLYDFYMYLKFIELSPENLEFYLWFKNYEAKCNIAKSSHQVDASDKDSQFSRSSSQQELDKHAPTESDDSQGGPENVSDTLDKVISMINPISACSAVKTEKPIRNFIRTFSYSCGLGPKPPNPSNTPDFSEEEELNHIAVLFLTPGSPKELNIPPTLRNAALLAMRTSTSPHHLQPIANHCYELIRHCSHRNFIRLGVGNGTFETVCVATSLGVVLTLAGFLLVLLRALHPFVGAHARWDVFAAWPLWGVGAGLILSGLRGSCFFLLLFSRRQQLPWEHFGDDVRQRSEWAVVRTLRKLMIFDRKVRVNDAALRSLQRRIVVQSLCGGAVVASLLTLVFIFLPVWKETGGHA